MSSESSPLLNMDLVRIDPACALRVPPSLALRRQILPVSTVNGEVFVACADAEDSNAVEAVRRLFEMPVRVEAVEPDSLRRAIHRLYGDGKAAQSLTNPLRRRVDSRAVLENDAKDATGICDELMHAAIVRQASDVHIDPGEEMLQVRFRVDGVLERYRQLPIAVHHGIISRFKVLAGMDIAEKRAPQDGRFSHRHGSQQNIDVRVATLPTTFGERMTLRLLALQTESLTLERLGMSPHDLTIFEDAISRPHGMVLLTGPTGSGKTTTLYAALRRLIVQDEWNIVTIEDPIEYRVPAVAQVEVDTADKVSFGKALRSVLRHDPDIIMIGEIRDLETADVAVKASLTGHLVLSTLHTNSAASVVTRLTDMGIERYLTAATLRLAVAQRLVRQLCENCRQPRKLTAQEAFAFDRTEMEGATVYEPGACVYCASRGYRGRIGVFEMLSIDEVLSRAIAEGAGEAALVGQSRGVTRLSNDAFEKVLLGMTTVRDALSAVTLW